MKAVVDASFLLTMIPGHKQAATLAGAYPDMRDRLRLIAPSLLVVETANAIHGPKRAVVGATKGVRRRLHLDLLEGIEAFDLDERLLHSSTLFAERHGLTVYDSLYLALAAKEPLTVLLTEDKALLAAARKELGEKRVFTVAAAVHAFADIPGG